MRFTQADDLLREAANVVIDCLEHHTTSGTARADYLTELLARLEQAVEPGIVCRRVPMVFEIESGDHCEGYRWEYHRPYESHTWGSLEDANRPRCAHVSWVGEACEKKRSDGSVYAYERQYTIPEAAKLLNEGGHNCTILCLRCADEARAAHNQSAATPPEAP